jgi:predicted enzyme related to lactoylglutathione lyase
MPAPRLSFVEFPADDTERARRFWSGVLGSDPEPRGPGQGEGWQTAVAESGAAVGVHARGPGPGDSFSLPYFEVADLADAVSRVEQFGGSIVHPGERWTICKDSEGNPFALSGPGAA